MSSTIDSLEPRLLLSHGLTPLAPAALVVSAASASDVKLSFADNSKNETGFVVERAKGRGTFATIGTLAGSRGRGARVFDDGTVAAGTAYRYRVRAVVGDTSSAFAGPVAIQTVVAQPPPTHRPPPPVAESPRNLLFFGNSFTLYNGLATLVADIAAADGHAVPNVHVQASGGWSLTQQLDKVNADGGRNVIEASLAAGQHWDDVVLQDRSEEPTSATAIGGNVGAFLSSATGLFQQVRENSPQAHGILFETWARGADNPFYPGTFASPSVMQYQLQGNYGRAVASLAAAGGTHAAEVAPVGEVWRARNWDRSLYDGLDEYHPSARGSLLAALTLYTSIYHDGTSDIAAAKVSADLARLGVSAADWSQSTALTDSIGRAVIATL